MEQNAQVRVENIIPPILEWYEANARDLPWRENRDPYRVWVSEIMLQQTRVEAVKPYFARFMETLPTVKALADASEDVLLKLWEGLGYYSRVRNLQKAAKVIVSDHGGVFPCTYDEILALPGIGPYTAGAIGSICFGLPTPAVDGNVLRVMARLLGDDTDINAPAFKRDVTALLADCYPVGQCGQFTQSLMELGATVCIPNGTPQCSACPVRWHCKAFAEELQDVLPVKSAKKPRKVIEKTVLFLSCGESLAVRKRSEKGLLHGLWEYPNVDGWLTENEVEAFLASRGGRVGSLCRERDETHIFTHVEWHMRCYAVRCDSPLDGYLWVTAQELMEKIPLPTAFGKLTKTAVSALEK